MRCYYVEVGLRLRTEKSELDFGRLCLRGDGEDGEVSCQGPEGDKASSLEGL